MGTMIQAWRLGEPDYRGERFRDWPRDLKGHNDLLSLTQPDVIRTIHREYLEAGADILETNTFNSTAISMADYGMEELADELNVAAAGLARAARRGRGEGAWAPAFVAGVLGPTNRTASISPEVNDPGFRNVTFEQLVEAYGDDARGLLDGGADLLLVETIFDTLNAKAAIFAIEELFDQLGWRVPVMISVTIIDRAAGRCPARPSRRSGIRFRMSAAERGHQLRPGAEGQCGRTRGSWPGCAGPYVSAYPNAGLPDEFAGLRKPREIGGSTGSSPRNGWLNLVGGCCGTTPTHSALAAAVSSASPDSAPAGPLLPAVRARSSPSAPKPTSSTIGERTNVTGSRIRPARPQDGDTKGRCALRASRSRRAKHPRRQHGRGLARRREGHDDVSPPGGRRTGHRPGAGHDRQLEMVGHRSRAEMRPGQGHRQFDQPQGGRGEVSSTRPGWSGATARPWS